MGMTKAQKRETVATLLASIGSLAYASGTAFSDAGRALGDVYRLGSTDDYDTACRRFRAGRIVASIMRPDVKMAKEADAYRAAHWANYGSTDQMIEAAEMLLAKSKADSTKPDRRTKFEDRLVAAANSALSLARKIGGIPPKNAGNKGSRKPRAGSNPPDGASVSVASPKFSNDNEARDHFRNVLSALATTCEINQQTGAPKSVKGVAFKVQTIILEARKAVEAALAE